jgi:hypothetical protein
MCITTERHSTICGHKASHTQICRAKRCENFLGKLLLCPCSPFASSVYVWEICHTCRHFWNSYGSSESTAIEKTIDYRAQHNYQGPLTPHSWSKKSPPVLMQEIELRTTEQLAQDAAARRLGEQLTGSVAERIDDATRHERDLTSWIANIDDKTNESVEVPLKFGYSTETLWANFYPGSPDQADERTEPPKDKGKDRDLENPCNFEAQNPIWLLAGLVDSQGFVTQSQNATLPGRPISKMLQPTPRPGAPDINKPLPQTPRPDSPVRGLKFDSEYPETYLSKNKI